MSPTADDTAGTADPGTVDPAAAASAAAAAETANTAVDQAEAGAQQTSSVTADAPDAAAGADAEHSAASDAMAQAGTTGADAADAEPEAEGSPMGEHIMQRLRYFENYAEHLGSHIKALEGRLMHSGITPPSLPHFPSLKSPLGNYNPHAADPTAG